MCIISWFPSSDCKQLAVSVLLPCSWCGWHQASSDQSRNMGMSGVATGGCDDHKSMKERPQNEISVHPALLLNQQRPEHFIIIIKTHYSQRHFWKEYIYQQMIAAVRSPAVRINAGLHTPYRQFLFNRWPQINAHIVMPDVRTSCASHWFTTDLFSAQEEVVSLSLDVFLFFLFF